MAEHNALLASTADEVAEIRDAQRQVQEEMILAEKESLERWRAEKERSKVDEGTIEALVADSEVVVVESPVDANVSIFVSQGDG